MLLMVFTARPPLAHTSVALADAYSVPVPGADNTASTETPPPKTTTADLAQALVAQVRTSALHLMVSL